MHADAPRGLAGVARVDPDRVALVCGDRPLTFGELDGAANAMAHAFAPHAAAPGDRVAVMMGNSTEAFAVWHGVTRLGALVVPVSTRLTEAEVAYIVEDCGRRASLVHDGSPVAAPPRPSRRAGRRVRSPRWTEALARGPRRRPHRAGLPRHPRGGHDLHLGDDGPAQGHRPRPPPRRPATRPPTPSPSFWGFGPDDVHLMCGPMYHTAPERLRPDEPGRRRHRW